MKAIEVGSLEAWFPEQDVEPFPYGKTYEEAEWEPLMVLHTSGSTGIPKPIIVKHALLALGDDYRDAPDFQGYPRWMRAFAERAHRHFIPSKLFCPSR